MAEFWYDPAEEYEELLEAQAKEKAQFCMATGVQPSEYDQLNQYEINAFIKEANRRAKKGE